MTLPSAGVDRRGLVQPGQLDCREAPGSRTRTLLDTPVVAGVSSMVATHPMMRKPITSPDEQGRSFATV